MSGPLAALAESLETALRARVPLIALITHEEERALRGLVAPLAERHTRGRCLVWSITDGFLPLAAALGELSSEELEDGETLTAPDPASALEAVLFYPEPALFVLKDFHSFLENAAILRRLRDLAARLPGTGKHLLFLSPRFSLPEELEKAVELVDVPLPDTAELDRLLDQALAAAVGESEAASAPGSPEARERLVQAALGLTAIEARQSFARALARTGDLSENALASILAEKKQAVRRSGILEFYEAGEGMDAVGGLELLKGWLVKRRLAFSADARRYGLSEPRGVLLLGVQGCGKSLVAKAVSQAWQMPLLRLDLGRVFGRYLGESEAGIRTAIRTAEAVAPAILWLDELEKGFAGATVAAHDTGVSARVLGTFLTWMQEREKPVFVVATANSVRFLPPELLRRGRFDEIFFIELPTPSERRAILTVHLKKRGRDPSRFDLDRLDAASDGYTGAEIEGAIGDALFDAYADARREVTTEDILAALAATTAIAVTMRESITAMRQWAATRARPASLAQAPGDDTHERR
jgi:SpoVK/Ycf46/Vps4 family AAA+-type ATPase